MGAWLTGSLSGAGFAHKNSYGVPLQFANYLSFPLGTIQFMPEQEAKSQKRTLSNGQFIPIM